MNIDYGGIIMFEYYINDIFSNVVSKAKTDIEQQNEEYILNCNYDELVEFFYEKHRFHNVVVSSNPVFEWHENKGYNGGFSLIAKYYITDGKEMLQYHGSSYQMSLGGQGSYPIYCSDFGSPRLEWYQFTRHVPLNDLDNILSSDDNRIAFENRCFSSESSTWLANIAYLNVSINSLNEKLKGGIKQVLTNVISVLSKKIEIRNKLKIGMMPISDIRHKKVDIKIVEKKEVKKPVVQEPYYYISNEDYDLIIQIISRCMIQYERTPNTFTGLGEEDIRNIIMGAINANFEFDGSAESFSNSGHTDIMILAKNKAAFIAECKLWKGSKYVSDGIDQLLGYTTYKDGKLALLVFNKDNKDYNSVLSEMNNLIISNDKYIQTISHIDNKWQCLFKSNHSGTVKITFIIANYHFEK